eukprot:605209_1
MATQWIVIMSIVLRLSTSSDCGYYGPRSGNITSQEIPLMVCGNYGVGDLSKSLIYECDENNVLHKKIYETGHNCDDSISSPTSDTIANSAYKCHGSECHGYVLFETYPECSHFVSGEVESCKCTSSSIQILNTDVCIVQHDTSHMISCTTNTVIYQYYNDTQCEQAGDARFYYQGCNEQDKAKYTVQCSGTMTRFNPSLLFAILTCAALNVVHHHF